MADPQAALAVRTEEYAPLNFSGLNTQQIQTNLLTVSSYNLVERFNSGKSFTFVKKRNELLGEFGWKPKEIPNFDPVLPNMVLHDIWEHSPGSPATPIEEFQAIGTAMLIRFEGGFFNSIGARPSDALARAFGMLYYHAQVLADRPTTPCPNIPAAHTPIENTDTEMEMVRAVGKAVDYIHGSNVYTNRLKQIDESLKHALPWMRVGYRKAQRRFAGLDYRRLSDVYFKTSEKLKELIQNENEVTITPKAEKYQVTVKVVRNFKFVS